MNVEELRRFCLSLSNVSEAIKWENNLCFMLFEKIFMLVALDAQPTRISFKVPKENFTELVERDGFNQAPYFAKGQWVIVDDLSSISDHELKFCIQNAYQEIKAKLPKKLQALCNE